MLPCPACHQHLAPPDPGALTCPHCGAALLLNETDLVALDSPPQHFPRPLYGPPPQPHRPKRRIALILALLALLAAALYLILA